MNKVIMLGRLTRDVEVRYTQSAEPTAVASFAIAVDRSFKREGAPDVDFFNCVCFGKRGENISRFFRKGNRIAVSGRLENRSWTDNNGQKRYATDIIVEEFDFCESKASSEYSSAAPAGGANWYDSGSSSGSAPEGFFFSEDGTDDSDLPF